MFYKGSGVYDDSTEVDIECPSMECVEGYKPREVHYESGDSLGSWQCEDCGNDWEYEFPDINDIDYDPYE